MEIRIKKSNMKIIVLLKKSSPEIIEECKSFYQKKGYDICQITESIQNYDYGSNAAMSWLEQVGADRFEFFQNHTHQL
jgi:hypothetical protein